MEEEVFSFDVNFQKKILRLMIDDPNFLAKSKKYIKETYFETEILRWCYKIFIKYYDTYNKVVTLDVFKQEIMDLPEEHNKLEYFSVVKDIITCKIEEKEYIITKLEEWIKRNLIKPRIESSVILYNQGKIDKCIDETRMAVDEFNKVSFASPHRVSFFEEIDLRITKRNKRDQDHNYRFTTGNTLLDSFIGGGLSRGELGVVVADAKVGKSIFLLNAGAANVASFAETKVLHINLEGKESQVEDRYDSRLLNVLYKDVITNNFPENYRNYYKNHSNRLIISNLIGGFEYSCLDVEKEIIEVIANGFIPDVLIVDYGDLLRPRNNSSDMNSYKAQEEVYRDLKTLANKYNCAVWTASQVGRADKDKNPTTDNKFFYTRKNLADSYTKVRVADLLFTLNMTDEEKRNNRMRGYLDAYRDAECGQIISYSTDYSRMKSFVLSNDVLIKNQNYENK